MAEKEGENGRMRKRKGGSKWLKGKRGREREREKREGGREYGGCCHSEAKAITHLLLKIMKKT